MSIEQNINSENDVSGPEMTRLLDRLYGNRERRVLNFKVLPGPKWDTLSVEQKARSINEMLDSIDNGDIERCDNIDD